MNKRIFQTVQTLRVHRSCNELSQISASQSKYKLKQFSHATTTDILKIIKIWNTSPEWKTVLCSNITVNF